MALQEAYLGIDFETVAAVLDHPEAVFFSREYLRPLHRHLKQHQPHLNTLLKTRPFVTPTRHQYFRAGALGTYDLIVAADPRHWEKKKISKDTIFTTRQHFAESTIRTRNNSHYLTKDNRAVSDMEWFYDKLTTDSPTYAEWLQLRVDQIEDKAHAYDFIYGSLLTAMPFYLTRESEELQHQLSY